MQPTDNEILTMMRSSSGDENKALRVIYKLHFAAVQHFITLNGGDSEQSHDVFQEGVIIFHKNVIQQKFKAESSIGTYLFAICRFVWLKKLQKQKRELPYIESQHEQLYSDTSYEEYDAERSMQINDLFGKLGDVCKQILTLAYYEQLPMAEIANLTGYKDEQNARNKKLKCMNALRELINTNPALRQMLRN
ncbi:MAG: RNA polymerase sigma factor [Flavobacteriales bacterium]